MVSLQRARPQEILSPETSDDDAADDNMAPNFSFFELSEIFRTLDKNGDGVITHIEFIKGLKEHPDIAAKLAAVCCLLRGVRA